MTTFGVPLSIDVLDSDGRLLELSTLRGDHAPVASRSLEAEINGVGPVVVRFDILSASHRVGLGPRELSGRLPDWQATETVACGPSRDNGPPPPGGLLPAEYQWQQGPLYLEFTSSLSLHPTAIPEAMAEIEQLADSPTALIGQFPGHSDAITAIAMIDTPGNLGWRTWHLYPGPEAHVVTTRTAIAPTDSAPTAAAAISSRHQ